MINRPKAELVDRNSIPKRRGSAKIKISGLDIGMLDLENKVAYLLDSKIFSGKIFANAKTELDAWRAYAKMLEYHSLTQELKRKSFRIYYESSFMNPIKKCGYGDYII